MEGNRIVMFIRDYLSFILLYSMMLMVAIIFLILQNTIDYKNGDIVYFLIIEMTILITGLIADYAKHIKYSNQLISTIKHMDELHDIALIDSPVTTEQKLVVTLLKKQNSTYLNKTEKSCRQQEFRNHFTLQWVHHMKTPISIIDLHLQEVSQENNTIDSETLESIKEELYKVESGLKMMLDTARLDKFEIDLQISRLPLHELIRNIINEHKELCIRYAISPHIEGEAWIETDKKWFNVVINQFISNSIKYSKNKSGAKSVLFKIGTQPDGTVTICVKDEGIGILESDIPRIFDPFFTGENGRITGESTGMGLYLVKQICDRLGYKVSVSSEKNIGTSFIIHLNNQNIYQTIMSDY
ncbi:sensor histidine kinase [Paenibacillus sp. DRB1-1]|uniref:sensor histidine kinase n=1 Tax=Paenibacillus sp. DRB1-1 TaxID=3422309 RepID=UPI0019D9708E|nr:sensor histidine kinase [Paenibacillus sp. EKM208P]